MRSRRSRECSHYAHLGGVVWFERVFIFNVAKFPPETKSLESMRVCFLPVRQSSCATVVHRGGGDDGSVPGGEKAAAEEALRYKQRWLFTPAIVLSAVDSEPGVSLIRTKDMEVHR